MAKARTKADYLKDSEELEAKGLFVGAARNIRYNLEKHGTEDLTAPEIRELQGKVLLLFDRCLRKESEQSKLDDHVAISLEAANYAKSVGDSRTNTLFSGYYFFETVKKLEL
ncbi:MAG: hypothetical protein KGH65_03950 [Candidatus Micrarchaeota archaeon]|nr:hypothetical protein [Candidatus Micrarchaeota archaeon]